MKSFFPLSAICPAAIVTLPVLAVPATNIPPIIVEASRVDGTEMEIPAAVQVLTRDAIGSSGARDLPDLLEKRAGIHVRHMNANPLRSSLSMRGFGENSFGRVLVLVDGERLNNPDMEAPDLTRVPLGAIDRIEIIHGPQTVLYGDSASAGVVHVRTAPAAVAEPLTTLSAHAGSRDTYGAAFRVRGGDAGKGEAYSAGFRWRTSGGYRQNGGYDLWNADGGVRKTRGDGSFLLFSVFADRSFYEMPGALSEADYAASGSPRKAKDGALTEDEADLYSHGLGLSGRGQFDDARRIDFDGSVSRRRRDVSWRGTHPLDCSYEAWTASFSPRYVDETPLGGHESVFLAGADFHADRYDAETSSDSGPDEPAFVRYSLACLAREEFYLAGSLSLIAGVRGERFESDWEDGGTGRRRWDEIAWEGGLDYRPSDDLKLFSRASRFYRAPFCDEMSYVRFNDELEPETGRSLDAGATWRPSAAFAVTLSAYYMETGDEIFFNPHADYSLGHWTGYNENSPATTRRAGLDFLALWRREKRGGLAIAYHFADARFSGGPYDDREVPLVPRQSLRLSGERYLFDELAIGGGCRFLSSQGYAGDFENARGRLPGYGLVDGLVRVEPSCDALGGLSIEFTVENIFDRKFSDFAGWNDQSGRYYYPGAGRSFFLNAKYEF